MLSQWGLYFFKSDFTECQTNTEVGRTWPDIIKYSYSFILIMIMFKTWNWSYYITKIIKWFTTIIFCTGRPCLGSIPSQKIHAVFLPCRLFSDCLNCLSKLWRSYLIPECSANLSRRACTTGNLPCHDSLDQYHTVARITTGSSFYTGFATSWT